MSPDEDNTRALGYLQYCNPGHFKYWYRLIQMTGHNRHDIQETLAYIASHFGLGLVPVLDRVL
jgi:hypothetical protein